MKMHNGLLVISIILLGINNIMMIRKIIILEKLIDKTSDMVLILWEEFFRSKENADYD